MSDKSKRVTIEPRKVALYCRVAREDDNAINEQKQKLNIYAEKQGFDNLAVYADKGASGIRFDRPALLRLLNDVEAGTVDTVIVYDFARFSRNALEMGRFIEGVFPKYGVRFISVMDGFDSAEYESEADYMASVNPIRVILNLYNHLAGSS